MSVICVPNELNSNGVIEAKPDLSAVAILYDVVEAEANLPVKRF